MTVLEIVCYCKMSSLLFKWLPIWFGFASNKIVYVSINMLLGLHHMPQNSIWLIDPLICPITSWAAFIVKICKVSLFFNAQIVGQLVGDVLSQPMCVPCRHEGHHVVWGVDTQGFDVIGTGCLERMILGHHEVGTGLKWGLTDTTFTLKIWVCTSFETKNHQLFPKPKPHHHCVCV